MAVEQREFRTDGRAGRRFDLPVGDEPPIGELFRQLSDDATTLIRQEVALGKAEIRETASALGRDAAKIGVAAVLGWFGAMTALAFVVLGLGDLIDNYWLSALIVTVVLLAVAAVMGKRAMSDMRSRNLKPTRTIDTLQEDADWMKRETAEVKREWQS